MLNKSTPKNKTKMPDIAHSEKGIVEIPLDRVGMTSVQLPLKINIDDETYRLAAKADLFVNLSKKEAKGIHMSRLFLKAQKAFESETFSIPMLKKLLDDFLESHKDLSNEAYIKLDFDYLILRQALLSDFAGWRSYPMSIIAKKINGQFVFDLNLQILYSSTCPCSAALSRQLIQDHFEKSFQNQDSVKTKEVGQWLGKSENIVATPHSQRSHLNAKIRFSNDLNKLNFNQYLDLLENALATPVQTAVKREDEQEFARLNASNLMFCEDAARKAFASLDKLDVVKDFWIKVDHKESLHPHNAVSIVTKGIENGFSAD